MARAGGTNFSVMFAGENVVVLLDRSEKDAVEIHAKTITTAAEDVVRWAVQEYGLKGRRLFYIDTDNRLDELLVGFDEEFAGFNRL